MGITAAQLLDVLQAHKNAQSSKRKASANHALIDSFYTYVRRDVIHPGTVVGHHDHWACFAGTFTFTNAPEPCELTVDIPEAMVKQLPPDDAPYSPPDHRRLTDLEILRHPEAWTTYPRLYVERDPALHSSSPFGYIDHHDQGASGNVRIKLPGRSSTVTYDRAEAAIRSGWTVARRDLERSG